MGATERKPRSLVANGKDNVAVLLDSADSGDAVTLLDRKLETVDSVVVREPVRRFHKIAIREIADGESIVKLGEVIGRATHPIACGDHVHVHNVESARLSGGTR